MTAAAQLAVLAVALVGVLAGCSSSEQRDPESVASQEAQMKVLGAQIEEWGEEILAQIPEEEIEDTRVRGTVPLSFSENGDLWPQFQSWSAVVRLKPEGARSPVEMSDDLEPWVLSEGWECSICRPDGEGEDYVLKSFSRDGYTLSIYATREALPDMQRLDIEVESPPTKP